MTTLHVNVGLYFMLLSNWSVNDDAMHEWLGYDYYECETMIF